MARREAVCYRVAMLCMDFTKGATVQVNGRYLWFKLVAIVSCQPREKFFEMINSFSAPCSCIVVGPPSPFLSLSSPLNDPVANASSVQRSDNPEELFVRRNCISTT